MNRHTSLALYAVLLAAVAAPSASDAWQAAQYDILLKGGHVIDPRNAINGPRDVAVSDGRIARVDANIPATTARKVIDVTGFHVTPGFIDIHTHNYYTIWPHSLKPEDNSFSGGTTTLVDCGSSGWRNFPDFKETIIDETRVRVLAFINIEGHGLAGRPEGGPGEDFSDMSVELTVGMIKQYPETIVGIKVKSGRSNTPWGPLDMTIEAGRRANVPVIVDDWPTHSFEEFVLEKLRPGDIHTHVFANHFPIMMKDGTVNPVLRKAQERGVIFDVGHGMAAIVFRNAVPAAKQGFYPNTISTDLHRGTVNGPAVDMLNVMSKFVCMGIPLEDVVRQSTSAPADAIRRPDLGSLSVGAEADVAVFEVRRGRFSYTDTKAAKMSGDYKLEARLTLMGGRVVYDPAGYSAVDWTEMPAEYWETPDYRRW